MFGAVGVVVGLPDEDSDLITGRAVRFPLPGGRRARTAHAELWPYASTVHGGFRRRADQVLHRWGE